jgi:hypothetical protein
MLTRLSLVVAVGVALTACGTQQTAYRPVAAGQGVLATGPNVATYAVPPQAPQGRVQVVSLGGERLQGQDDLFLHVRLDAENSGDATAWRIESHEQRLVLQGGAELPPSYATTSAGGPVLSLNRGQRGYVDLYYPLPPGWDPPRLTLSWRVRRADQMVALATGLDRVSGRGGSYPAYGPHAYAPYEPYYGTRYRTHVGVHLGYGYDPFWGFYDPFWYGPRYYGPRYYGYGPRYHYAPRPVYVPRSRAVAPPSPADGWRGGMRGGDATPAPSGRAPAARPSTGWRTR